MVAREVRFWMKEKIKEGVPIARVAREYGVTRQTIYNLLAAAASPAKERKARGSKLDPFKSHIVARLAHFDFFPGEWMAQLPNLAAWRRVAHRLPMMNPLRALVRQSKTLFALWQDADLPLEDRELIARHLPHTEPFRLERLDEYREERDRWVLKRAFGRMGDAVVLGSLVSAAEWDRALAEAARDPHASCMQDRFRVRSVPFGSGPLYPALGAYLVNGRFAGYYSRVASRPFITHEAHHVATLVRAV